MNLTKAFVAVLAFLLAGGAVGGGTGYVIGAFFPDALRAQFRPALGDELNPVQVGVGLGLPQGLTLGAVVGVAVVGILAWQTVRTHRPVVTD